ncbi:Fis family transcriptional regulator [Skermania sp. ID1734]|uniref:sigma-54-dependent Fis family transcriptional regulator n=1 Tax=Skermania sp. ID1734 TaxID=2597516 RepID=UPI00118170F1|nr:helix-turn-helix domain-containing protein [Skermania sp. ID1734]TSE02245.1 Fis family transcriptional regulator [Skermania sp. ID1734]
MAGSVDFGGQIPARPEIALSWKRSALSGVDPGDKPDTNPVIELDAADPLLRAARPVLDEIRLQITGTGVCVLLADNEGRLVGQVFDTPALERRLERLGAVVGSSLGEDRVGTNALGTPLETRQAIVVNGEEHFLERFKGLSCYGQPIIHPVTRRVEGILDMTAAAAQANPLFAPFLARAAADIERRLLEGSRMSQRRLVDAFQRVSPQRNLAVTAIGEDILLSNKVALDLLDGSDHAALRALIADLRPDQSRTVQLRLSSGNIAQVQADPVAGTDGGALFLLRPQRRMRPIPRKSAHAEAPGERIRVQLQQLRDSDQHVAICGEPGSGRTTAMRDLVGDAVTFDAATLALQGSAAWLTELGRVVATDPAVVAVENVQLLPETAIPVVAELLSVPHGPRVILTSGPVEQVSASVAAVLARCPARMQLPPLRQRGAELADIARGMLEGIAPGLGLTPRALEALRASDWPGNLSELAVVLRSAAQQRSSNRIELTDLPERYQVSSRVSRLAGRERAEREAIIAALQQCAGNKVHAAASLGISRSTLYARMRALDIDG